LDVIVVNWKKITHGFLFGCIDTVAFYILSIVFPIYFNTVFGTTDSENHLMILFLMGLTTIPLPFFGYLGDLFSVKKLMIGSTIGILLILYPLFITLNDPSPVLTGVVGVIFLLCLTCITALLPFLMCSLFSTSVRYTCMGLSFNLADGILGGISPVLAVVLLQYVGLPGSVFWMLLIAAFVSLFSFMKISEKECR
jgi:MHS family proline/betaine transporter-like MFS transporter